MRWTAIIHVDESFRPIVGGENEITNIHLRTEVSVSERDMSRRLYRVITRPASDRGGHSHHYFDYPRSAGLSELCRR